MVYTKIKRRKSKNKDKGITKAKIGSQYFKNKFTYVSTPVFDNNANAFLFIACNFIEWRCKIFQLYYSFCKRNSFTSYLCLHIVIHWKRFSHHISQENHLNSKWALFAFICVHLSLLSIDCNYSCVRSYIWTMPACPQTNPHP